LGLAASFAFVSCGGGSGSGPSIPPPNQTGVARFTISIPAQAAQSSRRLPRYVSAATRSATLTVAGGSTVTVAGGSTVTVALIAGSPLCTQTTGFLVCTVDVTAPVGTTNVTISTFASTDGSGTPLSTQTLSVTVVSGLVTTVNVSLNPVVASMTLTVTPSMLAGGIASTSTVQLRALDPAGNLIIGPGSFVDASGNPLTITLHDSDASGATSLTQTTFTAPAASATTTTLTYNGALIGNFTITATAPGLTTATATVTVNPAQQTVFIANQGQPCVFGDPNNYVASYQALSTGGLGTQLGTLSIPLPVLGLAVDRTGDLFVLEITTGGPAIMRYPLTATGSAAPSATITGASTGLNGPVRIAADSSGGVWVAQPAVLLHFAPNANGNVAPDRTITGIAGLSPTLTFDGKSVSLDSHDNVYTVADGNADASARAFALPAASSGVATPTASYGFIRSRTQLPGQVDVDRHTDVVWLSTANIYAGGAITPPAPGATPIDINGLIAFAQGGTTPTRVLYGWDPFNTGMYVYGMATDNNDNLYVDVAGPLSSHGCQTAGVVTFSATQNGSVTPVQAPQGADAVGVAIPVLTAPI
jgi:hypothetical protein